MALQNYVVASMLGLCLAFSACYHKGSDTAAPTNPNNPARQACRVALITDSASGAQTEQILYDGEKRPARINFFSGGSDNDLFGYYTYAYDGNGLSVTGHRPDGTVDTTVGTIRARVLDGLITQYTRSVTLGGTMVLDSSTVTYDSLGIPMRLTQIHRVKPQGDTLTRTVQQLDFITADGLVMHIEQSYVNQPYPADSSRYRIESYDLVFGATPIVCNTPFLALQVLPGYLFYLGNKLPVSYSYRARNRLGHISIVPTTLTAVVNSGGFPTSIRLVAHYRDGTRNDNTKLYSYSCE